MSRIASVLVSCWVSTLFGGATLAAANVDLGSPALVSADGKWDGNDVDGGSDDVCNTHCDCGCSRSCDANYIDCGSALRQ